MATHFLPLSKKCVLHIYTPRQTSRAKFHENWWKTEEVVRDARFSPPFFAIICRYHGNTLSTTVKKCVLHIYTPRQTSVPNFMRIGEKTEEVVRDARFFPHFCHNMPLPWQHTFYHCQKKCVLHIYTPKANICAKFHENWWKNWGSSSRRKIFPPIFAIICRYHGNTLSTTVKKCVLHIYTPRQTSVPNFMRIGEKLRK